MATHLSVHASTVLLPPSQPLYLAARRRLLTGCVPHFILRAAFRYASACVDIFTTATLTTNMLLPPCSPSCHLFCNVTFISATLPTMPARSLHLPVRFLQPSLVDSDFAFPI